MALVSLPMRPVISASAALFQGEEMKRNLTETDSIQGG